MVESFGAAVKGVGAVVPGQFVFYSVKSERGIADAVGIAAEGSSEGVAAEASCIQLDAVVVADHVGIVAVLVGSIDTDDVTGIVGHLGGYAAVGYGIQRYGFAVNLSVEGGLVKKVAGGLHL